MKERGFKNYEIYFGNLEYCIYFACYKYYVQVWDGAILCSETSYNTLIEAYEDILIQESDAYKML